MRFLVMIAAFFTASVAGTGARAQERPVVVVVSTESSAIGLAPDAVRAAVSEELGAPAVRAADPGAAAARGTLTVSLDAERRLVVAYRDALGREVWRTIAVPDDPVAAVATVALLAGNLARDEAGELLAGLGVAAATPAAPAPAAPVPAPGPATEGLALPPPPAPPVLVLPAPESVAVEPAAALMPPVDRGEDESDADVPGALRDSWEVVAALGATIDFENDPHARFELQGARRWGRWALGAVFTTGSTTTFSESFVEDVEVSRNSLLAVGELRQEAGPFFVDVGLGLGGMVLAMTGPSFDFSVLMAQLRVGTSFGYSLGERFDVVARADASSTFEAIDAGGAVHPYGPYDLSFGVGMRGRI